MKSVKILAAAMVALLSSVVLPSCNADGEYVIGSIYPTALVTVKPTNNNTACYLQLDDTTTLKPVNIKGSPYGAVEMRALIHYLEVDDDPAPYTRAVRVAWMDDILTKKTIPHGTADSPLGDDPLEIVKDWVTLVEDGYLTLRFRTRSSGIGTMHRLNLVTNQNSDRPYEVRLYHDAQGDTDGDFCDGLVAFDLSELPDTKGEKVKLTLRWNSYSGEKSVEFDYCTRGTATIASGAKSGGEPVVAGIAVE